MKNSERTPKQIEEKRVRDTRWREKNREKVRASQRKYESANKEKVAAAKKKWLLENPEKMQECRDRWIKTGDNWQNRRKTIKKWHDSNLEKVRANTKQYREEHKEEMKGWIADWGRRNIHKLRAYARRRQVAKLQAIPAWADLDAITDVYQEAAYMQMHVDHIVPLRSKLVCGLHVIDNLQLLPPSENIAKGNRHWPDMP